MGVGAGRKSPFAAFRGAHASADDDAAGAAAKGAGDDWDAGSGEYVNGEVLWNQSIADALGYGKKGSAAAFQWWIPILAGLTCLGSYIAWLALVVRGRDATDEAMRILSVNFPWWRDAKGLIVATAVMYPIFLLLALAVSAWRAHLARTLNIHQLDPKWMSSCRKFQVLNVASGTLLWIMVLLLVGSVAGHAVWGYMTKMMDVVSVQAVQLIGPVWGSVSKIAESSTELTNRFNQMLGSLPAVGRRHLLEEGAGAGAAAAAGAAATVGVLLGGGAGPGRELQQAGGLLGQLAQGIAQGISAAAAAIPAALPGVVANVSLPGLPQILPNGSANPLFGAITEVTNALQTQILNPNGCPVYCIDLRAQRWWADASAGCVCNLDRIAAAVPHFRAAWEALLPAVIALLFMYIGASWLLMHGAAQWARTRTEVKLMGRIPGAAAAAAAAQDAAAKASADAVATMQAPVAHV